MWQKFLGVPHLSEYLSLIGILLTLFGFAFSIWMSFKAKGAAEAAQSAAEQAKSVVKKLDLVSEVATVLQLLEELKRLHRSASVDVVPDRYSSLKIKVLSIRESGVISCPEQLKTLQDVISRLNSMEKALDKNSELLSDPKGLSSANGSLSKCTEAMVSFNEKIKSTISVIS